MMTSELNYYDIHASKFLESTFNVDMDDLTDIERSHSVANWAYTQAEENEYLLWQLSL